jgi:hypothetical protein
MISGCPEKRFLMALRRSSAAVASHIEFQVAYDAGHGTAALRGPVGMGSERQEIVELPTPATPLNRGGRANARR